MVRVEGRRMVEAEGRAMVQVEGRTVLEAEGRAMVKESVQTVGATRLGGMRGLELVKERSLFQIALWLLPMQICARLLPPSPRRSIRSMEMRCR
eukprot:1194623-Prorocentrum_minimum.AAC.1